MKRPTGGPGYIYEGQLEISRSKQVEAALGENSTLDQKYNPNSHSHNPRLPLLLDGTVIDDAIGLTTNVAAITPADPKGYISRFRRSFSKPVDEFKTISDPFEKVRGLMQALSYYLYVLNSHRERDSGYKPSSRPVLRIHNLMSLSRRSSSQLLHTLLSRPSVRPKRGN